MGKSVIGTIGTREYYTELNIPSSVTAVVAACTYSHHYFHLAACMQFTWLHACNSLHTADSIHPTHLI